MISKTIWRLPDVLDQTGLSRSTIYELIRLDDFPRQIKLGPRAVGWLSEDVLDWINSRIESSHSATRHEPGCQLPLGVVERLDSNSQ